MSIVIHHMRTISGDTRGIREQGGFQEHLVRMLKVWATPEEDMVFGLAGDNASRWNHAVWTVEMSALVREYEASRGTAEMPLPDYLKNRFGLEASMSLMIGTARNLYLVGKDDIYLSFHDETIVFGNGSRVALYGAKQGLTAEECARLAMRVSGDSGGDITTYNLRKLTAIPQRRKGAKK